MKRKNDELGVDKKKKRKNSNDSRWNWLTGLLIISSALLLGVIFVLIEASPQNQGIYSNIDIALVEFTPESAPERITVRFNEIDAVLTEQSYHGVVRLIIEGFGQAGGEDYSDAFYLFAHSDNTPYDPPQLEHFDLEIDGQRAIYTLGLLDNPPAYNPAHLYSVDYFIGDEEHPIAFRISDSIVDDNNGEFRIEIYQLPD